MNGLWQHLPQVSTLDATPTHFAVILGASLIFTLIHAVQELKGHLWRYFGAIAGLAVPDVLGVTLFVVVLTVGLWAGAFAGVAGWLPGLGTIRTDVTMTAVGFLIGGRLSDSWFSHIRLSLKGYRPNPGLTSTPLYVLEAALLILVFSSGLRSYGRSALAGLALGILLFVSVLPVLRLSRGLVALKSIRRDPWIPGEPRPS